MILKHHYNEKMVFLEPSSQKKEGTNLIVPNELFIVIEDFIGSEKMAVLDIQKYINKLNFIKPVKIQLNNIIEEFDSDNEMII